jgi:hypothetical protein
MTESHFLAADAGLSDGLGRCLKAQLKLNDIDFSQTSG